MKHFAYPSHSQGKSNCGIHKNSILDRICAVIVIGGCVSAMFGLVSYANYRDSQYFKSQNVASFPSRPEECNLDCPPMDS